MKRLSLVSIVALSISVLGGQSALADCPGAGQTYTSGVDNTFASATGSLSLGILAGAPSASSFDTGGQTDGDCFTPGAITSGAGSAVSGTIIDINATPADDGIYVPPITAVYGPNNAALGNGANVGTSETYTEPGPDGVLGTADDVTQTRLVPVHNSTAIGANASVEHNHSTALGAGTETDRANQIVLGTEDDEVTIRNLPNHVADEADTTGIVVHKADGTLASDGGRIQGEIDANTASNTAHDATLADHEGRITTNEGDIADLQSENASQQTEIDNNTAGVAANAATNATQQTQLDDHEGRIGNNESDIATNASGIAANKAKNVQQDNRLSGHDATLATHNNRIDTNAENIAINSGDIAANAEGIAHNSVLIDELTGGLSAVAAMPDSYLNPDENFALAAGFGGYSDKTAFGVLGTARLTNNLSAYGGASIPLDDGDIAWKVGGRVGF